MRTHTIPLPHKYSWGFNNSGQCGLGHRDPVLAPQPILEAADDSGTDQPVEAAATTTARALATPSPQSDKLPTVARAVASGNTSALLTTGGELLTFGSTHGGRLGRPALAALGAGATARAAASSRPPDNGSCTLPTPLLSLSGMVGTEIALCGDHGAVLVPTRIKSLAFVGARH